MKKTSPKERKGNWPMPDLGLPILIAEAMAEVNPTWDWLQTGEYIVVRCFEEGEEFTRIAAKIIREDYKS